MSACRPIKLKQESRPRWRLAGAWPTIRTRPTGGRSPHPRITASTSRPGRTARTTKRIEPAREPRADRDEENATGAAVDRGAGFRTDSTNVEDARRSALGVIGGQAVPVALLGVRRLRRPRLEARRWERATSSDDETKVLRARVSKLVVGHDLAV